MAHSMLLSSAGALSGWRWRRSSSFAAAPGLRNQAISGSSCWKPVHFHFSSTSRILLTCSLPRPVLHPMRTPIPLPTAAKPLPSTLQLLTQQGLDRQPLFETWGLPWESNVVFGGLAYTLGGRSLYFGGWSPQYLDTEMHVTPVGAITADTLWPEPVVQDLKVRFFAEAAEQTGTTTSNDYINGDLHDFVRRDNAASLRAHLKMGMKDVASFEHDGVAHAVLAFTAPRRA